jgi:predicted aspartyl protease
MNKQPTILLYLIAGASSALMYSVLVGLGVHRYADPIVVCLGSTVLLFGPPLLAAFGARRPVHAMLHTSYIWSLALFLLMPVYFPGERAQALQTGLSLVGIDTSQTSLLSAIQSLPDNPGLHVPQVAREAATLVDDAPPLTFRISDTQMALPFEGRGRSMTIPVVFRHGNRELEVQMMLDTGATYTTLPRQLLEELNVSGSATPPALTLHTANGTREADIHLVDQIWLGDLSLENIAVTECESCEYDDSVGLLGLNITGGYNLNIDADQRIVTLEERPSFSRHLDIKPFVKLNARFRELRSGRVEIDASVQNPTDLYVSEVVAAVQCAGETWTVPIGPIEPGDKVMEQRLLPEHMDCEQYTISMHSARW